MEIAVLNIGTATVKAALFSAQRAELAELERCVVSRELDAPVQDLARDALVRVGADRDAVRAVGHRVVHGGDLERPTVIDASVERRLEALGVLAPLHNPAALSGIRAARGLVPDRPQVAVFDTAFHAGRPEASRRYALPWRLADESKLYRYGFHGIAHASLVDSLARALGGSAGEVDAVTLQLGSGCSACAVRAGRSIETSMGFTPLEGLAMPTRAGDLDAGVVLQLLREGHSVDEVECLLHRDSGLLGLGGSADVRTLLGAEARGDERAHVALELFVRRIVFTVGGYWTHLAGQGALVFGGGIGTHSAEIRHRVVAGLSEAWGVALDESANRRGRGRISTQSSRAVFVFETDEESRIARSVADWLPTR